MNDKEKDIISESLLKSELPSDILYAIYQNNTSLGNNPAIPDIYGTPYLYHVVEKAFNEAKETLKEIGSIDDVKGDSIKEVLARLIKLCQEKERPYRNQLEKICFDHVIDMFGVPKDMVDILVELKDKIEINSNTVRIDPADGEDFTLDSLVDAMSIKKEVFKRRLLDVLCLGAGVSVSNSINNYKEDIAKIDPMLPDLYFKILSLNNYLLFETENFDITDKNPRQMGTVEIFLGKEDDKVRIKAQGMIFPVLLCEMVRGFMELFISHGLPTDRDKAIAVIEKSDYLKAEPWDMRLGPSLWKLFEKSANDVDFTQMPYLLKRVSSLDIRKFNFLFKEIFASTKKGKEIMSILSDKAKKDCEYDDFLGRMDLMNKDKGVITDEYIHIDEL
jgi:hypothetical protein